MKGKILVDAAVKHIDKRQAGKQANKSIAV